MIKSAAVLNSEVDERTDCWLSNYSIQTTFRRPASGWIVWKVGSSSLTPGHVWNGGENENTGRNTIV